LRRADDLGCDFIATGHYARVRHDAGLDRHVLSRGLDRRKDQSYALWGLPQHHLARSIFPLGRYTKPQIRQMAADFGLDRVAQKPDSYEICFVPDDDYGRFLRDRVDGLDARVAGGDIVLADGTKVGTHDGYPFYTVGQRRGLDVALGRRVYVTHIDPATNTLTVGPKEDLMRQTLTAREINLVKYADLCEERAAWGAIRYNDDGAPCLVWQETDEAGERLTVAFAEPRRAITPGQSVVLYEDDDLLAGGWIHAVGGVEADGAEAARPRIDVAAEAVDVLG
jgi:tRNA-specific 2-thiouridylase